ncbi:MAG: hypothetical protein CSB13_09380 [Chloroflexi bacterium]|nr:MAG: hypothetical protein CSB13_09380 [Chloroflexota bacterium]
MRPHSINSAGQNIPVVDVDVSVECSSGTYVRALARDIGKFLGVGGHLIALRRTRVGTFSINDAHTVEQLAENTTGNDVENPEDRSSFPLIGVNEATLRLFPVLRLNDRESMRFSHGQAPEREGAALSKLVATAGDGPLAVVSSDGTTVMGLVRIEDNRIRTLLVFEGH